jgi:ribose transport system substrate-binding protein
VAQYEDPVSTWTGPTTGPAAAKSKRVIYVSADQTNGGALGVSKGFMQACKIIHWTCSIIDGQGTVSGQTQALDTAIAEHPDGIVLGTVDAQQEHTEVAQAHKDGISVVGWHSTSLPGPSTNPPLFTNITTDPVAVAKATADYAIAESGGKAGVVIFTDSSYAIAILKSTTMEKTIKQCPGCKVLAYENTPLADTPSRMGPLTTSLEQRFGKQWTWGLGINDLYFDYAPPALRALGVGPSGPPNFISAGDGSVSAFQRIRGGQYQAATVAEPLIMQGWQTVDEMNRAFQGQKWSGFVPLPHLVVQSNINSEGGPQSEFNPANNYEQHYEKIWGVS